MPNSKPTVDAEILFQRFWVDRKVSLSQMSPEQTAKAAFYSGIMASAGILIGSIPQDVFKGDSDGNHRPDNQSDR